MTTRVTNGLNLQGQRIQNMGEPSVVSDAATKNYVDNVARGLFWKAPVRLAATSNVNLASPGTTFDGKTAAVNDRILLMNQTTGSENGIYVWSSGTSALVRATDADDGMELNPGVAITVTEGATYGDKTYINLTDGTITIGTSATTWGPLGGGAPAYTASNGIQLSGLAFTGVVKSGGGLQVDSTGFSIDTSVVGRKVSGNVGNGSSTTIDVVHNLATLDVMVGLRLVSTGEFVVPDWVPLDVNTVRFSFPTAPASGAYRATIFG